MTPKIIHYIWFGNNPYPKKIEECIKSWHKYLPDYELKLWNEESFDLKNSCRFVQEAYKHKKYAFVSDYVRIYALYHYGGIYLDTDIEVVKKFDNDILDHVVTLGTDEGGFLTALMMSQKGHILFKTMLEFYESAKFVNDDGSFNMEVNNTHIQNVLKEYGYNVTNTKQKLTHGIVIYPDDYFHARSLTSGKLNLTTNTYAIHWHTTTWVSFKTKLIKYFRLNVLVPLLGTKLYTKLTLKIKNGKTTI